MALYNRFRISEPLYQLVIRAMYKFFAAAAVGISMFALPAAASAAYQLPGPVSVQTSYASGAGAVDFTKPAEVHGVLTISDDQYDAGEYITAGDVGSGATGFGFYAKNGMLYAVSSDGSYVRRTFADFFAPGTSIFVNAKYSPVTHRIDFHTQTHNPVLNETEYGTGVVLDNLPLIYAVAADPLRVLLNPQNYGTTTVSITSWSYTE